MMDTKKWGGVIVININNKVDTEKLRLQIEGFLKYLE